MVGIVSKPSNKCESDKTNHGQRRSTDQVRRKRPIFTDYDLERERERESTYRLGGDISRIDPQIMASPMGKNVDRKWQFKSPTWKKVRVRQDKGPSVDPCPAHVEASLSKHILLLHLSSSGGGSVCLASTEHRL